MPDATPPIPVPTAALAALCRKHRVRELSLFGSVLRDDFRPDNDFGFLVEFETGSRATFITLGQLEEEPEVLVGRPVDLVTKRGLKPLIRADESTSAHVLSAA